MKILKESSFDPKDGGPLAAVLDAHGDDPVYLEKRGIEMVREAQLSLTGRAGHEVYVEKMQKAIWLLAIARAVREIN